MRVSSPSRVQEIVEAAARGGRVARDAKVVSLEEVRAERVRKLGAWQEDGWRLEAIAGRLVEVSGEGGVASIAAVVGLVHEAQVRGEPVGWIGAEEEAFFPPDLAESGIDLEALVVVHVAEVVQMARAAETMLRSGAFGMVVMDLGTAELSMATQSRLVGIAQRHEAALVAITEKPSTAASLGSIVSLRVEAAWERGEEGFRVAVRAIKDKRRGPGWEQAIEVVPPAGLGGPVVEGDVLPGARIGESEGAGAWSEGGDGGEGGAEGREDA